MASTPLRHASFLHPRRSARPRVATHRSLVRLIASYAAISLVPIVLLGLILAWSYRSEARQRGLAEGRSEAVLVAQTAVEPHFSGRPLSEGLSAGEEASMQTLVHRAIGEHRIIRLRLHTLSGDVVYSSDRGGFTQRPEDEVTDAAHGHVVAQVSRLNSDPGDLGKIGPATVEVYLPLTAGSHNQRIGVLEIYLPYAPISADVTSGLHRLYRDLVLGLAALYLAIAAISISVSRRLRQQRRSQHAGVCYRPPGRGKECAAGGKARGSGSSGSGTASRRSETR